jgi:hypothetical protein
MIPLWMQIGLFIWRLPRELESRPLNQVLAKMRGARRVRAEDVDAGVRRIAKIRRRWLRLRFWTGRNTCYTRALVMFRFVDPNGGVLEFHLGAEPARVAGANIHGHAWVTLNGLVLEPLPGSIASRVSDLYAFPPRAAEGSGTMALEGLAKHASA